MLGKLIKHEFKDTIRLFWPIFSLIVVLTPLFAFLMKLGSNGIFSSYEEKNGLNLTYALQGGLIGYYLLLVGLFLGCQIMMALRFYRTIATNEAYLTFTLPTSTGKILFSKWLIAMLYYIVSGILAFFSILFTIIVVTPATFKEIVQTFEDFILNIDIDSFSLLSLVALVFIVSGAAKILQFYVSIVLGQLFRSHRAIISIGFYIALSVVLQIVSSLVLLPVIYFNFLDGLPSSDYIIHSFLLILILFNAVLAGGFYFTTYLIIRKRLNVR